MPENNLFDIKKRINAAMQTRKITRTMELIASSRLQRNKVLLANYQEWLAHMREAAMCLPNSYFEAPADPKNAKKAYIVFGGSKGLSGAYSPNLLQFAKPIVEGHIILAVGSATEVFFPDAYSFLGDEIPSADYSKSITQTARTLYENHETAEVYMLYTRKSKHVVEQLFPLIRLEAHSKKIYVEPSSKVLFPALFEEYSESVVYEAHLQAFISEQVARISAMDTATRNADEIIDGLQAMYNRIRQASITQEIISVSNTVKGGESKW